MEHLPDEPKLPDYRSLLFDIHAHTIEELNCVEREFDRLTDIFKLIYHHAFINRINFVLFEFKTKLSNASRDLKEILFVHQCYYIDKGIDMDLSLIKKSMDDDLQYIDTRVRTEYENLKDILKSIESTDTMVQFNQIITKLMT
jgi:hypothetical protein